MKLRAVASVLQEPFEPGLAQSLETGYKQSFCGLQQSGEPFVEELGPSSSTVMKKELQESSRSKEEGSSTWWRSEHAVSCNPSAAGE